MIAYLLVLIGAMNWGFKALNIKLGKSQSGDLVEFVGANTSPSVAQAIYGLVALSGLALAVVKIVKLAKKNKAY